MRIKEERVIVNIPDYDGPGIYMIRNIETGKVYIGSSRHIMQRIKSHDRTFRKKLCNARFLEDIEKGHKFTCTIIEKYDSITRKELLDREKHFVKMYDSIKSGYNIQFVPTYDIQQYIMFNNQHVVDWLNERM